MIESDLRIICVLIAITDILAYVKKMELQKYYLAHYDFIKEGYQVIGDKGEITRFVITECDNYINTKTPIRTENVRTMKRR